LIQFQKTPVAQLRNIDVNDISISDSLNRTARAIPNYVLSQAVANSSGSPGDGEL